MLIQEGLQLPEMSDDEEEQVQRPNPRTGWASLLEGSKFQSGMRWCQFLVQVLVRAGDATIAITTVYGQQAATMDAS